MNININTAVISECGKYRYRLTRAWAPGPRVMFFMMNPSTADATKDDATIRKCIGFAKRWGYSGIEVVNLSAWRSTDPHALSSVPDLFGPEYEFHIGKAWENCNLVVLSWGCEQHLKGKLLEHAKDVMRADVFHKNFPQHHMKCLGQSKTGNPYHPLMLAYDTPLRDIAL